MRNKEIYDSAIEKFERNHSAGKGAFEEYVQLSKFMYGIFLKSRDTTITTKNFRESNIDLMYRIRAKVEKHPWLFRRFFMIG